MSAVSRWKRARQILAKSWYPIPPRVEALLTKVFVWWWAGLGIAYFLPETQPKERTEGELALAGAVYAALAAWAYYAARKYRLRHGLPWAHVIARAVTVVLALVLIVFVIRNRNILVAFLPFIALLIAYVAAGLVVLYVAVRVIRAAWRHDQTKNRFR